MNEPASHSSAMFSRAMRPPKAVSLGHGLRAGGVQRQGAAVEHALQVRADVVQVARGLIGRHRGGIARGGQPQQHLALVHKVAFGHAARGDMRAPSASGNAVLHLHRFQHQGLAAGGQRWHLRRS